MNHTTDPTRLTVALYDAIDVFQRTHCLPGLQHAQIRGLLAEHLARALPAALPSVVVSADRATLLREAADHLAGQADELWMPGTKAHTVMHADADELRRLADGPSRVAAEEQPAETQDGEVDADTVAKRAAQVISTMGADIRTLTQERNRYRNAWHNARARASDAEDNVRVVEAETQDGAEAHPAEHTWAAELHDPLVEEWVPGTRYLVRDRAVNALAHAKRLGPTWKDGTPTERRLVRATTTYTVEAEYTPPAVAEQPDTQTREAFVPPAHYRGRDGTAYCVHATPVGPDSCRHCRELAE